MDNVALFDTAPSFLSQGLTCKLVTAPTAEKWMEKYHYSGTRGVTSSAPFGIFAGDLLAIVCVGPTANADGVVRKYDLHKWPGNHEITRVAVHPDRPPMYPTSMVVAMALRAWHHMSSDQWVFSYADTGQGHTGSIYQALNAVYLGVSEGRPGWLLNGESIHPRSVVARYGTQARVEAPIRAARRGETLVYVADLITAKHTYILPIGTRSQNRGIRKHLERYRRPYPRRELKGKCERRKEEGSWPKS